MTNYWKRLKSYPYLYHLVLIAGVVAGLLLAGFRKRAKKEQESEVEVAEKAISGTPVQA